MQSKVNKRSVDHQAEFSKHRDSRVSMYIKIFCFFARYKEMASYKMESLQKSLSESVPASSLEEANREFADLTAKYRDLLQREQVRDHS